MRRRIETYPQAARNLFSSTSVTPLRFCTVLTLISRTIPGIQRVNAWNMVFWPLQSTQVDLSKQDRRMLLSDVSTVTASAKIWAILLFTSDAFGRTMRSAHKGTHGTKFDQRYQTNASSVGVDSDNTVTPGPPKWLSLSARGCGTMTLQPLSASAAREHEQVSSEAAENR